MNSRDSPKQIKLSFLAHNRLSAVKFVYFKGYYRYLWPPVIYSVFFRSIQAKTVM